MKNIHILLPPLIIFSLTIFLIIISQAMSKEDSEEIYQKKYSFVEDRIDDTWTIEEGMHNDKELLISVNGNVIHADRLRYRLMSDCETINVLTQFSTTKKNPKTETIKKLYVSAKYIEEDINVTVPFVNKLPWKEITDLDIDMWVFWIDLGWYSADMIKDYHKNIPEKYIKYIVRVISNFYQKASRF